MAKYWTPGRVKTRLGQSIGNEHAAAIHRQFVLHLASSLQFVADRRVFAVSPTDRMSDFLAALPQERWEITSQASGDLGRRIEFWFRSSLTTLDVSQQISSVLIGADCPTLSEAEVDTAFEQLNSHDVVLGPASDGGYYLIGLRSPWRPAYQRLFADIPWSGDKVFDMTVQRVDEAGLQSTAMNMQEDIDTIADLNRLRSALAKSRVQDSGDRDLALAIESILGESQP